MRSRSSWVLASAALIAVLALLWWQSPRGGAWVWCTDEVCRAGDVDITW